MVKRANRPTNKSTIATVLLSIEKFSMEDIRKTEGETKRKDEDTERERLRRCERQSNRERKRGDDI